MSMCSCVLSAAISPYCNSYIRLDQLFYLLQASWFLFRFSRHFSSCFPSCTLNCCLYGKTNIVLYCIAVLLFLLSVNGLVAHEYCPTDHFPPTSWLTGWCCAKKSDRLFQASSSGKASSLRPNTCRPRSPKGSSAAAEADVSVSRGVSANTRNHARR